MRYKLLIIILASCLLGFNACKKKARQVTDDNIEYKTVNFKVYPGNSDNFKIQVAQGWIYRPEGVNGIIIYRKTANNAVDDFVAIERTSPYLPTNPGARVKVLADNFTLKDTVSNSTWNIVNGALLTGPATTELRLYSAYYDHSNGVLTIQN